MKLAWLVLALQACTGASVADDPYTGDWKQVDLRSIESVPPCVRLWFEERRYALQGSGTPQGFYANTLRAVPVGSTLSSSCKYPAPASNPIALQMRAWMLVIRPDGNGRRRVEAEPAPGSGDLNVDKTEEFKTVLWMHDGLLFDGNPNDEASALVFRRPSDPSATARAVLEQTISRLESGSCLDVLASMGLGTKVSQACELRRRMRQIAGDYIGLRINGATEFHRMPIAFPSPLKTLKQQHGIHFSFNALYEKQTLVDDALVFEEGGKWRVAFLW